MIIFKTKLFKIKDWPIIHLPLDASIKLPSRGMIMIKGTLNGAPFKALLEPDGRFVKGAGSSHWFRPDNNLLFNANVKVGDDVKITLEPTKEWIEPELPKDVEEVLNSSPKAHNLWDDITPMARWDWIRWIRAVKTPETRQKHLDIMLDKLNRGIRRPCCFNRNLCSEPYVSKNWQLINESQVL